MMNWLLYVPMLFRLMYSLKPRPLSRTASLRYRSSGDSCTSQRWSKSDAEELLKFDGFLPSVAIFRSDLVPGRSYDTDCVCFHLCRKLRHAAALGASPTTVPIWKRRVQKQRRDPAQSAARFDKRFVIIMCIHVGMSPVTCFHGSSSGGML